MNIRLVNAKKNNRRQLTSIFFTKVKTHSPKKEQEQTTYILCRLRDTIRLYSYLISLTALQCEKVQNPEKIERRYQNQKNSEESVKIRKKSEVRRKSEKGLNFRNFSYFSEALATLI
jgi:hypothetical protein